MNKGKPATIRQYYKGFLDNEECRVLYVVPMEIWAKSTKQPARMKIILPNYICNDNVKDLYEWNLTIVAIPISEIEKYKEGG